MLYKAVHRIVYELKFYCENLQLNRQAILVTRPKQQAESLCGLIEQQGWDAIRFPTIEITGIDNRDINQQLKLIKQHQWLIFVSANAVNFAVTQNDGKIDNFKDVRIAAIGRATEKALQAVGLVVDLLPEYGFNTEGLLASTEMKNVNGKSCLIVRGEGGRETLAESLRERGAKVDYLEVYKRHVPVNRSPELAKMLQQQKLAAITVTSGEILTNLFAMTAKELHDQLITVPVIVISERIKELAESYKFKQIVVTENPESTAIIEALIKCLKK